MPIIEEREPTRLQHGGIAGQDSADAEEDSTIYPVAADVLKQHLREDRVAKQRLAYREQPDPSFVTYGPKTRREFLNLRTWEGG